MAPTLSSDHQPPPNTAETTNPATLLHLSFNQDSTCFAAGTDRGYLVHDCLASVQSLRRDLNSGGIGAVEMLHSSNIFALVGTGPGRKYPPEKVVIWEDSQSRCIASLCFRSKVTAVRLLRRRIVVVLHRMVRIFDFADLRLVKQIETVENPDGVCAVSEVSGEMVLACPGVRNGQVRVVNYGLKQSKLVLAHGSGSVIAAVALSRDGRFLATASVKGTLIRVFSTLDGRLLRELRRGVCRAEIYSIAFSSTAQWLAVSSDKGIVHIFDLKVESRSLQVDETQKPIPSNMSLISSISFIKGGVIPEYFKSEAWVSKFRLPEGVRHIVSFGHQKNTLVIIGMDGSFRRCQFDPESGGEMIELEHYNFLKSEETF